MEMGIRELTAEEVKAKSVAALGLDPTAFNLISVEALAGSLRRAATFLCPCSANTLVQGVMQALDGLVEDTEDVRQTVADTLQTLIAYGDLLEISGMSGDDKDSRPMIYAVPPIFVRRRSGAVLLIGIFPDNISPLPEELEATIEYVRHVRRIPAKNVDELASELLQLGFLELPQSAWLKEPQQESSDKHLKRLEAILDNATPSVEVPGLMLMDPNTPVCYYPGRWVAPKSQTGRFVARRDQLYGAKLWCYVEMEDGLPKRLVDFPLPGSKWRGCDEAWRLQAAIDATLGEPQMFRIRHGPTGKTLIDFFSPVPVWAQRRWDSVGNPVPSSGCLFSYSFSDSEVEEEVQYLLEHLWLLEIPG